MDIARWLGGNGTKNLWSVFLHARLAIPLTELIILNFLNALQRCYKKGHFDKNETHNEFKNFIAECE